MAVAGCAAAAGAAAAAMALPAPAGAATFVVDDVADFPAQGSTANAECEADDGVPGPGPCTLRAAVQEANGSPGLDSISLPNLGGDYLLTLDPAGEDLAAGGDLDVREDLSIVGAGRPVVRSDGDDRVFHMGPAGTGESLAISGIEVRGGGGVSRGAGIYVDDGTLSLSTSVVAGNVAGSGAAAEGGGVWFDSGSNAITGSTIAGNDVAGVGASRAGGIGVDLAAAAIVTNSTLSGNEVSSVAGSSSGGGAWAAGGLTLLHSTLYENSAIGPGPLGGSITSAGGGTVTLRGTIVAGGFAGPANGNCAPGGGLFGTQGANLEAPSTGTSQCGLVSGLGDVLTASAGLSSLGERGGPTPTHALLNGSPALDTAGSCFPLTNDQRGLARPGGAACDIGSFERQVLAPPGAGCFGFPPSIIGSAAGETIIGTPGVDVILGQGGNDTIRSVEGNDLVCAGKGRDRVFGGGGNDRVAGDDGNDRLFGQDGIDLLRGNAGDDVLNGGPLRDTLIGGAGKKDRCPVQSGGPPEKVKTCERGRPKG